MAISTIGTDALAASAVTSTKLASGVPSRSQLPAGTVLQVVQGTKLDTETTTSTSFVDVTGLTASITPTSATSKILVLVNYGCIGNSTNAVLLNIVRNSTAIAQPSGGSSPATNNHYPGGNQGSVGDSMVWLDSPATTSATTYKVQWRVDAGTGTINRHASNAQYTSVSTITLMEIAA